MKAWWKIRNKPRGHYCPMLEFGIALNPKDEKEIKELNIKPEIQFCYLTVLSKPMAPKCGRIPLFLPEWVFHKNDPNYPDPLIVDDCGEKEQGLCDRCTRDKFMLFANHINIHLSHHFFLPWRSGAKPDYDDFTGPVRTFLDLVLREINARIGAASESLASEEWGLEEEITLETSDWSRLAPDEQDKVRVVRIGQS